MKINNVIKIYAKLLAEENISIVESYRADTAVFDVENRIVIIPAVDKYMDEDIIHLFIAHEVSHALYTPLELMHEANEKRFRKKRGFFRYVNIVEDARIEKLIQKKFPGLISRFRRGYVKLIKTGFFGQIDNRNSYSFIDRVNVYFKTGLNVKFTPDELVFVEKIKNLEKHEDVIELCEEIFNYVEKHPNYEKIDLSNLENPFSGEKNVSDDSEYSDPINQNFDSPEDDSPEDDSPDDDSSDLEPQEVGLTEKRLSSNIKRYTSKNCEKDAFELFSLQKFEKEKVIIDSCEYLNYYKSIYSCEDIGKFIDGMKEYVKLHKDQVNILVNEFNRKKSASSYRKAKTDKTGKIDVNKLHSYKTTDDIFLSRVKLYETDNHGIIISLDNSTSVGGELKKAIATRALILAEFCRKVNVPYEINCWTTSNAGDIKETFLKTSLLRDNYDNVNNLCNSNMIILSSDKLSYEDHLLMFFKYMIHADSLLNNIANSNDFSKNRPNPLVYNGLYLKNVTLPRIDHCQGKNHNLYRNVNTDFVKCFVNEKRDWGDVLVKSSKIMSCRTPIISAIYYLHSLVDDFKKRTKREKNSVIVLTDGLPDKSYWIENRKILNNFNPNYNFNQNNKDSFLYKICESLKTKVDNFTFVISVDNKNIGTTEKRIINNYVKNDKTSYETLKNITKNFNEQKITHHCSDKIPFDELIVISDTNLALNDEKDEITDNTTVKQIGKIFNKKNINSRKNKIFAKTLIKRIA